MKVGLHCSISKEIPQSQHSDVAKRYFLSIVNDFFSPIVEPRKMERGDPWELAYRSDFFIILPEQWEYLKRQFEILKQFAFLNNAAALDAIDHIIEEIEKNM